MRKIIAAVLSFLSIACSGQKKEKNTKSEGRIVVAELAEAGYFNLTEPTKVDSAKKYMAEAYDDLQYFTGMEDETNFECHVDNRFYRVDPETLFEPGGLIEYLDLMKNTFVRLGLKLEYSNEHSDESGLSSEYWKHTIDLNGKIYTAFDGKMDIMSWKTSVKNFIAMLNDQLELQGNDNRIYLAVPDETVNLVFMTEAQYAVVKKYYPNDENLPRLVK